MNVSAPAKLNLSLRVLGKRDDGFHELETLMIPLPELADELQLERAEEYSLEVEGAEVGPLEENLVTKALRLFEQRTRRTCRYRVRLVKNIPAGAGLGGGSSDAAAMLRALHALENDNLDELALAELAAMLGSDVPFFLGDGPCWCKGRGEVLEPAEGKPLDLLLLKPSFGVSTPEAYGRWAGSRELPGVRYEPQSLNGVELVNDLERPVFEKFVFLAEMKSWLLEQIEVGAALMSGSGATVFAVLHDAESGKRVAARARAALDPHLWSWSGRGGGRAASPPGA